MANELALILKSPVEELIPKMIAWNNAELLARVEATLEQYKGVTYDDSQIATAKADRAQLNAFCKALNDERIRIGTASRFRLRRNRSERVSTRRTQRSSGKRCRELSKRTPYCGRLRWLIPSVRFQWTRRVSGTQRLRGSNSLRRQTSTGLLNRQRTRSVRRSPTGSV